MGRGRRTRVMCKFFDLLSFFYGEELFRFKTRLVFANFYLSRFLDHLEEPVVLTYVFSSGKGVGNSLTRSRSSKDKNTESSKNNVNHDKKKESKAEADDSTAKKEAKQGESQ